MKNCQRLSANILASATVSASRSLALAKCRPLTSNVLTAVNYILGCTQMIENAPTPMLLCADASNYLLYTFCVSKHLSWTHFPVFFVLLQLSFVTVTLSQTSTRLKTPLHTRSAGVEIRCNWLLVLSHIVGYAFIEMNQF